jgi:hypothetical protein
MDVVSFEDLNERFRRQITTDALCCGCTSHDSPIVTIHTEGHSILLAFPAGNLEDTRTQAHVAAILTLYLLLQLIFSTQGIRSNGGCFILICAIYTTDRGSMGGPGESCLYEEF